MPFRDLIDHYTVGEMLDAGFRIGDFEENRRVGMLGESGLITREQMKSLNYTDEDLDRLRFA